MKRDSFGNLFLYINPLAGFKHEKVHNGEEKSRSTDRRSTRERRMRDKDRGEMKMGRQRSGRERREERRGEERGRWKVWSSHPPPARPPGDKTTRKCRNFRVFKSPTFVSFHSPNHSPPCLYKRQSGCLSSYL